MQFVLSTQWKYNDGNNVIVLWISIHKKSVNIRPKEIKKAEKFKKHVSMRKTIDPIKSKNFDDLLKANYGNIDTKKRSEFEENAQRYLISEMLKEARSDANLTQDQLADKIDTKKATYLELKRKYNHSNFD